VFNGARVILRVNPDRPRGHHEHVKTAGPKAKFGIPISDLPAAKAGCGRGRRHRDRAARPCRIRRDGSRSLARDRRDPGQGGREASPMLRSSMSAAVWACRKAADAPVLDLSAVDADLAALKKAHPGYQIWMEPGRYPVAEAGVLLARVTQVKTAFGARFIGLGTGMNSLIRPALYGARHEMVNLTRLNEEPRPGSPPSSARSAKAQTLLGADRLMPDTRGRRCGADQRNRRLRRGDGLAL
jgi:diaminopimelate decarboxylase/aspartate kinase